MERGSDFLSIQANVKLDADARVEALGDVASFLAAVTEKEARLLAGARGAHAAPPRSVRRPLPSAASGPTAAPSASDVFAALHAEGNAAIEASDFARAASLYSRVLVAQPGHFAARANRALAHLRLKEFRAAILDATDALRADPLHTKSWMRRAAARAALGQHELAGSDLAVARAIEPTNRVVLVEARKAAESVRASQRRVADVVLRVVEEEEGWEEISSTPLQPTSDKHEHELEE